jgi:cytoskeletal protein CcmA (bactofilin family)
MGFFKDFKEDLSQAVNELLPKEEVENQIVNTLDMEDETSEEETDNEKLKEWLEEFAQNEQEAAIAEEETGELLEDRSEADLDENTIEEEEGENMDDNVDLELLLALEEEEKVEKDEVKEKVMPKPRTTSLESDDAVTVITKGTTINGSISSDGSLEINGTITGDVECLGKLSITGKVVGNSSASEVYVNTERLQGSITSEGSVKVGLGTVVIGDIVATSGVIAGAVKGEIDVNGPIVIDSTAIIKGNIKAKTVQINNGAVVEGFCSLSYSEVDVDNIFE